MLGKMPVTLIAILVAGISWAETEPSAEGVQDQAVGDAMISVLEEDRIAQDTKDSSSAAGVTVPLTLLSWVTILSGTAY